MTPELIEFETRLLRLLHPTRKNRGQSAYERITRLGDSLVQLDKSPALSDGGLDELEVPVSQSEKQVKCNS